MTGHVWAYARVSTRDQNPQLDALEASGYDTLVQEKESGKRGVLRPALVAAKRAVIDGLRLPLSEGLRLEAQLFAECLADPATLALQDRIRERYRETPPDVPVRF